MKQIPLCDDDRTLIKTLCDKLDRQNKQNTEIANRLRTLTSTFMRLMARMSEQIKDV